MISGFSGHTLLLFRPLVGPTVTGVRGEHCVYVNAFLQGAVVRTVTPAACHQHGPGSRNLICRRSGSQRQERPVRGEAVVLGAFQVLFQLTDRANPSTVIGFDCVDPLCFIGVVFRSNPDDIRTHILPIMDRPS